MAKGKLILICQAGGEFATSEDGTMTYNGGEANAANVTSETPFSELKLNLAETCNIDQDTLTVKYFLPGNKRNLITVKNDKDVKRMIDFHGDALTAEVFVTGTPGFKPPAVVEPVRETNTKTDETLDDDNVDTKKDEAPKRGRAKKAKKERKVVAKTPITSPARATRRSLAAAAAAATTTTTTTEASSHEGNIEIVALGDPKSEHSSGDSSTSSDSGRDNENVDSESSSDYVPSRYTKRKKGDAIESPADSVKKRRRTPSWKVGANGRPTIVSGTDDESKSKSRRKRSKSGDGGSGGTKSGRKSRRGSSSRETKSGRKRGRPRSIVPVAESDQEFDFLDEPSALAICDDDVSPETLVDVWKEAIKGADQEFPSVYAFQAALRKYAMANAFEYKLKKNETSRAIGECAIDGCSWKIYAVWVPMTQSFKIKTMNIEHTCDEESRKSTFPTKDWFLNTIKSRMADSPHLKPKQIANIILRESAIKLNQKQVRREPIREKLHRSDKDSYNKLPWFCSKIVEMNPGSVAKLIVGDDKRFKSLFVSFYASVCGFSSCRPLLFLESTSLRSEYGEVLLTALAIDGNDGLFPVGFAVVDVEDENNWRWFLEQLKASIFNQNSPPNPITFVFDRDKNLKTPVVEIFGEAHIGYSIYHLLESFKRTVKGPFNGAGKAYLPVHFLAAAHAVRLGGFRKSMEQIKKISTSAYDWVMQMEPQHWSTSSFTGERYNHITDDLGLSISRLMEDCRELPILHKIDTLITTMIDAINDAKLDASFWSTQLTPLKEKQLEEETMRSSGLKVLISSDTLFEVREDSTHVVNISNWSCTCLGWKEIGLPCRHALAVFALIGRNPYDFCSNYFTVEAYGLTYQEFITPVPITEPEQNQEQDQKMEAVDEKTEKEDEKMEVVDEKGEKTRKENEKVEVEGEKEDEKNKVDGEKREKGENEDEKIDVEEEKVEVEKGEGGKVVEDEGRDVVVLPPIPAAPAGVRREKAEWEETTEGEAKRTVTCTKCKQPGHNKKSCNFYQAQQVF